ncbi:MAG TPA: hypothetical protein VGD59_14775 [Acidisarcina sp.]
MHRRKPLSLALYVVSSLLLLSGHVLQAQETPPATSPDTAQPPASTTPSSTAPDANAPAATTPADTTPQQLPPQSPEQRAKVMRDAQARVRNRRQQRIAAIVADTYNHRFEGYFGGGYLRFRPGSTLQHDTEADWNVGLTDYLGPKLGITVDARGYYGTAYTGNNEFSVHNPSISQYTFMAGPQYRIIKAPKLAASLQVLAGVGHGNFDTGTGGLPGSFIGLYPNATVFNASAGVALDYNLGPGLALRLTPGVLLSDFGSTLQENLGFNAGVVYRFGRKK